MKVTVEAQSNIALVKYWGKRDPALNLPAAGSVSMTLQGLTTRTQAEFTDAEHDHFVINVAPATGKNAEKLSRFVDLVRQAAHTDARLHMVSTNNFPTAAGLASSASGFAALALAATRAAGLDWDNDALSELARRGSGSAARSIPGGFVHWHRGQRPDGKDSIARSVAPPDHWDLHCLVLVTAYGAKDVPSTDGMNLTMASSPFYDAWVGTVAHDIDDALAAIHNRDFSRLADVAERSCLTMHASAMAARPGVLYWNARTVDLIHRVRALRDAGHPCFFTIDAGPHVKVFCEANASETLAEMFGRDPNVLEVLKATPGQGAHEVTP